MFNLADQGEKVVVRRYKKAYAIIPIKDDELMVTPELQAKIDKTRQEYAEGKAICVRSHKELDEYLNVR